MARSLFDSAAEPFDRPLALAAQDATRNLIRSFRGAPAIHMQMFIALAHSLPSFPGLAWWTLLENKYALAQLRQEPALLPNAIEELLRFMGLLRIAIGRAQHQDYVLLGLDCRPGSHLAFGVGLRTLVWQQRWHSRPQPMQPKHCSTDSDFTAAPVHSFAVRYVNSLTVSLAGISGVRNAGTDRAKSGRL